MEKDHYKLIKIDDKATNIKKRVYVLKQDILPNIIG